MLSERLEHGGKAEHEVGKLGQDLNDAQSIHGAYRAVQPL
jgi:hypothetical protein